MISRIFLTLTSREKDELWYMSLEEAERFASCFASIPVARTKVHANKKQLGLSVRTWDASGLCCFIVDGL